MTKLIGLLSLCFCAGIGMSFLTPTKSVHDFTVQDIDGNDVSLSQYEGKVLLIVNVASKCGLTPQYEDLQATYEKYADDGLVVLGFPANNFLAQEPGSDEKIKSFCTENYNVSFPMFSKISVKGRNQAPLYSYLTKKDENGVIDAPVKWNFQKFLIDRKGNIVEMIEPSKRITEKEVVESIEETLGIPLSGDGNESGKKKKKKKKNKNK